MPLSITTTFKDHLAQAVTTLATCMKIDLVDGSGVSYFFTDHDIPIVFGGNIYTPTAGYIPSSQSTKLDLSVDNMSINGIIDDDAIKVEDLLAGRFDYADARIFMVNYLNPDIDGDMVLINGKLGKVIITGNTFFVELRGLTQFFQQSIGTPFTVLCTAKFGNEECKVQVDPPIWLADTVYTINSFVKASVYDERRYVVTTTTGSSESGAIEPVWDTGIGNPTVDNDLIWTAEDAFTKLFTVTSVDPLNPRRIFGTTLTDVDGHFDLGLVTWTVGGNIYFRMDVKAYFNANGEVELYEPMPLDIQVGDAGAISLGCDKKWLTCKTRYNNGNNFRGFPYLTGVSEMLRVE